MPKQFVDDLPLDGKVKVNWKASKKTPAFTEEGIYKGYLAGNPRRCAVQIQGSTTWIDRKILTPVSETPSAIHMGREHIAKLAEDDGEIIFAREVRGGCWDHRADVAKAIKDAEDQIKEMK
jgi:hypothetical protein